MKLEIVALTNNAHVDQIYTSFDDPPLMLKRLFDISIIKTYSPRVQNQHFAKSSDLGQLKIFYRP